MKLSRRGCLVFLLLAVVLFCLSVVISVNIWGGITVDWTALIKLKPPIFITQYRVVEIHYSDKDVFLEEVNKRGIRIDLWDIGEIQATAAATTPEIRKLRAAGFQVLIKYQSLEEYIQSNPQ